LGNRGPGAPGPRHTLEDEEERHEEDRHRRAGARRFRVGGCRRARHPSGRTRPKPARHRERDSERIQVRPQQEVGRARARDLQVKNVGKLKHDFEISGRKTKLLSPGQSDTLRVTFLRKGAYPYKCTVAGHAAAGMKGVFTIT
jgi:hypothetical protein